MHKKLIMACMAIAAFAAFVVAPAASASPALTSKGVLVPPGTSVTGVNTGITTFSSAITVTCDHNDIHGVVLQNTGSFIEGTVAAHKATFNGTGTSTDCTSNFFNAPAAVTVTSELCFSTVKGTDSVTIDGCKITTAGKEVTEPIVFDLTLTAQGPCTYETSTILATYKTASNATVNISGSKATLKEGSFFCPGSGELIMDFDLYTTDGTELTVS